MSTLHEENLRNIVKSVMAGYPDFVAGEDMSPKAGVFILAISRINVPREGASGEDALLELAAELTEAINSEDFEVLDSITLENGLRLQVTSRFRVGGGGAEA